MLLWPFSSPNVNKHILSPFKSISVETTILSMSPSAVFALTRLSKSSESRGNVASHSISVTVPTLDIKSGSAKAYVRLNLLSWKCNLVGMLLCFSNSTSNSPCVMLSKLKNFLVSKIASSQSSMSMF